VRNAAVARGRLPGADRVSDHALEGVRTASPALRRQSWPAAAWRQFRLERRMFWRNPTAAFFGFLLPLLLLAMFGAVFSGEQDQLDVVVPGIAGMSVMAATFVALAYNLTFLRERGILKRLRGTPLASSAYLAGIAGNAIANTLVQVAVVIVAGRAFFGIPWPGEWFSLLVFLAVGVVCFASLGVALSHAIPNSESAPAYVNAVFLPMIMVAGVFYDDEEAPTVLRDLAELLPLKHLIDGLSGAMVNGEGLADHTTALVALCLWAAAGIILAVRGFSWEARRS
jgi:ABC-2 type transport system permease protein